MKFTLYLGSAYFTLMSIAHLIGIKVPGLFIYYNVPSNAYQDRIIALLVYGWAVIFYTAAKTNSKDLIKAIMLIGYTAISILSFINLTTDFSTYSDSINPTIFHLEVGGLLLYLMWLAISYKKEFKNVG